MTIILVRSAILSLSMYAVDMTQLRWYTSHINVIAPDQVVATRNRLG